MRLEVRHEMDKKAKMTIAISDGANPYWNDRMEPITSREKDQGAIHLGTPCGSSMPLTIVYSLMWVVSVKVSWLARNPKQLTDCRDHMIDLSSSVKPLLNVF